MIYIGPKPVCDGSTQFICGMCGGVVAVIGPAATALEGSTGAARLLLDHIANHLEVS